MQALLSDVEKQEVIAGEIRSCVSIPDAKRIWQRLAALQVRRSDTEDRLNSLIQLLEERIGLLKVFELRYSRFTKWAANMEQRLLGNQRALMEDISDPLRDELAAKESETRWLAEQCRELSLICSEKERRFQLESQLANVEEIWRKLMETWNSKLQRLQQLPTDLDGFNSSVAELKVWLGQTEATLTNYTLLREWLGKDFDAVQSAAQSLIWRWESISQLADERSVLLQSLWSDWSTFLDLNGQLTEAMSKIEEQTPIDARGISSSLEVEHMEGLLESLIQELHSPAIRQKLDQFNEKYSLLVRDGLVDAARESQQIVNRLNARWKEISDRLSALLDTTRQSSSLIYRWQVYTFELYLLVVVYFKTFYFRNCDIAF